MADARSQPSLSDHFTVRPNAIPKGMIEASGFDHVLSGSFAGEEEEVVRRYMAAALTWVLNDDEALMRAVEGAKGWDQVVAPCRHFNKGQARAAIRAAVGGA